MEVIGYSRHRFAKVLGLTPTELADADARMGRGQGNQAPQRYLPQDLSAYRDELKCRPDRRDPRRQLFLNFKGGTGKTSLSTAYAYRLAEMGHKVLMVDLDSQGHAAKCLGVESEACEATLYEVLVKKLPLSDAILHTDVKEIDLVPSNLRMSTVDLALMPMHAREFRLRAAFESLGSEYEFIVMDAPPSFGLLNLNAILATDDLLIPVLADFLSFHGLKLLFETIADLEQDLQLQLDQLMVVINYFNPTTRIARQARAALMQHYPDALLSTVIRQCTKFAQASSQGIPISLFDPSSKGARDIDNLIAEVMPRTMPAHSTPTQELPA